MRNEKVVWVKERESATGNNVIDPIFFLDQWAGTDILVYWLILDI